MLALPRHARMFHAPGSFCFLVAALQIDVVLNLVTGVYDDEEQRVVYSVRHTA